MGEEKSEEHVCEDWVSVLEEIRDISGKKCALLD